MKKIFIGTLVLICLFTVACGKKEAKKDDNQQSQIVGGWELLLDNKANNMDMDEDEIKYFNEAKSNYVGLDLEPVALFGSQVVAGMNYMYLAKGNQSGDSKVSYKVVVVYHDLEGKNTITKVSDFDLTKYVSKNIDSNNEQLAGGWNVYSRADEYKLDDEKVQAVFEKATATLTGMNYKPLLVIGKQLVSGTNYAILCYGAATVPEAQEGMYLVTLYEDLNGNAEYTSGAYINLADYNK